MPTNLIVFYELAKLIYAVNVSFPCLQHLFYALFTMPDAHFNAKLVMNMLCKMLCAVNRTMLSARTTKRKHQIGKAPLHVTGNVMIGQFVDTFKESEYLSVVFEKANNGFIQAR